MEYFGTKNDYTKCKRNEAMDVTRPPIGVRWVDVKKGDDDDPNYRNRLVAKHFKRRGDDNIFATTPPLEAPRTLLMMAATPNVWCPKWIYDDGPHRMQASFADISRSQEHTAMLGWRITALCADKTKLSLIGRLGGGGLRKCGNYKRLTDLLI